VTRLGQLFRTALLFAVDAHAGQTRKATDAPYVCHPLQVAGIALEHGADEEQAAAALLHDVLEDTAFTYEDVEARVSRRVADIVRACSDSEDPQAKEPWRERKERYLASLRDASPEVALVAAADKLHNARSIVTDLYALGPAAFERFKGRRDGTLWYYGELRDLFGHRDVPAPLRDELVRAIGTLLALGGGE
jgi:(p)ppGpp synthase/HD superfamily hydrolase